MEYTNSFASNCFFDSERDTLWAHTDPALENILHVFDKDWHGVRNASGSAPGHKITISHKADLVGEELRYIFGIVHGYDIRNIIFQAYSHVAAKLAYLLRREFGKKISLYVITHVNASQFEHPFELEMLKTIRGQLNDRILKRMGSVKPDFAHTVDFCWPNVLFNYVPQLSEQVKKALPSGEGEVFIPLENTFRKNFYVNVIAAQRSDMVSRIFTVNEPSFLDKIMPLDKVVRIPYRDRHGIFELMSRVDLTMNVTFAECQPMTQLEALAVDTPCLTGPLFIEPLNEHPLSKLCTVNECDNTRKVEDTLNNVLDLTLSAPEKMQQMLSGYKKEVNTLAAKSYHNFLFD